MIFVPAERAQAEKNRFDDFNDLAPQHLAVNRSDNATLQIRYAWRRKVIKMHRLGRAVGKRRIRS